MGVSEGRIAHVGGLDGNSVRCFTELRKQTVDAGTNDYAGDGTAGDFAARAAVQK